MCQNGAMIAACLMRDCRHGAQRCPFHDGSVGTAYLRAPETVAVAIPRPAIGCLGWVRAGSSKRVCGVCSGHVKFPVAAEALTIWANAVLDWQGCSPDGAWSLYDLMGEAPAAPLLWPPIALSPTQHVPANKVSLRPALQNLKGVRIPCRVGEVRVVGVRGRRGGFVFKRDRT